MLLDDMVATESGWGDMTSTILDSIFEGAGALLGV